MSNLEFNPILLFWNIGKRVYEYQDTCHNIVERCSNFCSYYYGNSIQFSRENIHLMKRFYMNYPIYTSYLENFSWEQYQLFLKIKDKKERQFYYYLSHFFHSTYEETLSFIHNHYYERI